MSKLFKGKMMRAEWDVQDVQNLENEVDDLTKQIADHLEHNRFDDYNNAYIKRRAIGQRIIRLMVWNYDPSTDCVLRRLSKDEETFHEKRIKLIRAGKQEEADNLQTLQEQIANGTKPCRNERLRYMLQISERCGFQFIDFYRNLNDGCDDYIQRTNVRVL